MKRNGMVRLVLGHLVLGASGALPVDAEPLRPESEAAKRGMVVAATPWAAEAGRDILRQGGNAADAAVAAGLVLAVTLPQAGSLGGGGFALVRQADGQVRAVDFRETAPAAAKADMYLDEQDTVVPLASTLGPSAAAVPGVVAGWQHLWRTAGSGRLDWAQLIEPARQLAADGFKVSDSLADDLQKHARRLGLDPEARRIFLRDGRPYSAGDYLVQADLAATLERLQRHGARDFYTGETARRLISGMADLGGTWSEADLAGYRVVERVPLRGRYRGYEVLAMPPPAGGAVLLQMLGMLGSRDVRTSPPYSAEKVHLFVEVMRRAFRDRAAFLADPDCMEVPVQALLSKAYLQRLMADFDPNRATTSRSLPASIPSAVESPETTHLSVMDAEGNAVAVTITLNGNYGSGVVADGTGVLLNNQMDDFTARVGIPNMFGLIQGPANAIAAGKRPLSSMAPTIVLRDGTPVLVTGSPGGPTISSTLLLVLTYWIDHDMSAVDAVAAPRFHHQWMPDVILREPALAAGEEVWRKLETRGHVVRGRAADGTAASVGVSWGEAATIAFDPETGTMTGIPDPRSPDARAAGW